MLVLWTCYGGLEWWSLLMNLNRKCQFVQQFLFWRALLNACRVYRKPEYGKIAADNIFILDPENSGNHVLLSNMLATVER